MDGWIRLHRKTLECPLVMVDADHLAIWVYILLKATHKEMPVMFGSEKIILKSGQLITGYTQMEKDLGVNRTKIYRVLKRYESDTQIETLSCSKGTLITVVNWDKYQISETDNETEMKRKRNASETQVNTNKNIKNDKNIYNNIVEQDLDVVHGIVDYLNERSGRNFKYTDKTVKLIRTRMKEKFTVDDFKKVIDNKVSDWGNNPDMQQYIRPETLFGTKFEGYLNQKKVADKKTGFNEMLHTDYDFEDLEKKLLGNK